jgi:hypothetical protein
MVRPIIAVFLFVAALGADAANAQQAGGYKNFVQFKQLVEGIDFYASNRQLVAPFEKPAAEAVAKLKNLLGGDLPKGAIFVCSTLAQKDSIYEPKILKMGYGWTLTATTAEMRMQEILARIKSQMGDQVPAEILDRLKSRAPEMAADAEKQMVSTTVQQIAYAVLQTSLSKDLQYRSSRLDDMGKSPLPDWLDIGIGSYASGVNPNIAFLQQNIDQTFPIEDIISMSRPFVASSSDQQGGGGGSGGSTARSGNSDSGPGGGQGFPPGGMMGGMSGRGQGGFGGGGGQRGGGQQRVLSKDEQDRMLFDSQAGTLFLFMIDKVGIENVKELIRQTLEGKESREFIGRPDVLGPDFEKIEASWADWVKAQKPERTIGPRTGVNPTKPNQN